MINNDTNIDNIPNTGRIGRFAKIVIANCDKKTYLRILSGSDKYKSYKAEQKANWWEKAIENLEDELGTEKAIEIMTNCGSKCCGSGQRKTAKKMMDESSSLVEFLKKLSTYGVKEGELEYELIDENTIIARHMKCYCGQVKKSKGLFRNDTYCQCSVEFNRQFFKAALDKPVEVKLKQAILNGAEYCEFEIKIMKQA